MMQVSTRRPWTPAQIPSGTPSTKPNITEARPDVQRHAGPPDDAAQYVAAELVGPEGMTVEGARPLEHGIRKLRRRAQAGQGMGAPAAITTMASASSTPIPIGPYRRR